MSKRRFGIVGALCLAILTMLSAHGAFATAPANTGYDDTIQVIRGVGSDTTYLAMQKIEALYNQGPGCALLARETGGDIDDWYQTCQTTTGTVGANYDHDVAVSDFPAGSGAGVRMIGSATPGHQVDYARSSRDKQSGDAVGLSFNGFAKDGIAVVTMDGRTTANFTKAQLIGVFATCTITTWGQIYGNADTTPIRPYGVQTSSGTYLTFKNYLGGTNDPNACANAIGTGRVLFENDASQISAGSDGPNAVWWMSFGPYSTNLAKRATAAAWTVENVSLDFSTINDNSYPITRYLWHVIKVSAETATTGQAGATRAFRDWICKPLSGHITNPNTDRSFFTDISGALSASGFQRVPTAESDAGTRCIRQTT